MAYRQNTSSCDPLTTGHVFIICLLTIDCVTIADVFEIAVSDPVTMSLSIVTGTLKELGPFFFHFFQSYCDFVTIRIVIFF